MTATPMTPSEEPDMQPSAAQALPLLTGQRKRPRPGERRTQILQALAEMLEQPTPDRITTAALAARLQVSEAALYRHFASKAQMFEGLIEFIEASVFTLINQILQRESQTGSGLQQASRMVAMLLQFGEKNPGMVRVMIGDALVLENERLQQRMHLFFDKIEATLRQCLQDLPAVAEPSAAEAGAVAPTYGDAQVRAAVLVAFCAGRLQRFVRSGFRRQPTENLDATLALLFA